MLEHAVTYTFDRLKFTYLLITLFFILFSTIKLFNENEIKYIIAIVSIILVTISVININQYKSGYNNYIQENVSEQNNQILATYVKENFDYANSVMCSNGPVRGYINLLFDRGIYENKNYNSALKIAQYKNKRFLVYIVSLSETNVRDVLIKDFEDGKEYRIYVKLNQILKEEVVIK